MIYIRKTYILGGFRPDIIYELDIESTYENTLKNGCLSFLTKDEKISDDGTYYHSIEYSIIIDNITHVKVDDSRKSSGNWISDMDFKILERGLYDVNFLATLYGYNLFKINFNYSEVCKDFIYHIGHHLMDKEYHFLGTKKNFPDFIRGELNEEIK